MVVTKTRQAQPVHCYAAFFFAVALATDPVNAYPSSIIFAPTGESLAQGELSAYGYVPLSLRPRVTPAASWIGLQGGLVPAFALGNGLEFGGFEVGIDAINGAPHRSGTTYAKPIFNAKLSLLGQTESHPAFPALALGIMNYAPFQRSESVNLGYVALTKTLSWSGMECGSVTVGMGYAINAKLFSFRGAPPFPNSHLALLFGYSSPAFRGFSLAVDTLGGTSELSSTNIALSYEASDSANLMLGAFFANDRKLPRNEQADGVFTSLSVTWDPWHAASTK